MKILNIIITIFLFVNLIGCGGSSDSKYLMSYATEEDASMTNENDLQNINVKRKLIKTGSIKFETDDIKSTRDNIIESIKKYKGYLSSNKEYKSSRRINNTLIIRVPAKNFDLLLNDATKGVTKFDQKDINVKDVTEEFLDTEARLKTKKELENRYIELLKKANTVTEILEIEKQIGELRSEIESTEGRLKYLTSQVSFSTLTITIYQTVSSESNFGYKFKDGFKNGWKNLIMAFVALTNIWPFIVIAIGLFFGIKLLRKRKKRNN